jgi:nucleoside 2-deoxyribosyltransferase
MTITICGSLKFHDDMVAIQKKLEKQDHLVLMPVKAAGVDYWSDDNTSRVKAKKGLELISEHFRKIEKSDAVLIVNITKGDIKNYVGANTFLELGYAHYLQKKIYFLNPIPDQVYILDEVQTIDPVILNDDLSVFRI